MPVTSGTATVTSGRPLETSRPTGEPGAASCPASGSCASTSPAGAVRSYWDALADANPASWSVPFASASVIPVTSGTFAVPRTGRQREAHRRALVDLLVGGWVLAHDRTGLGVWVGGFIDVPDAQPGILEQPARPRPRSCR